MSAYAGLCQQIAHVTLTFASPQRTTWGGAVDEEVLGSSARNSGSGVGDPSFGNAAGSKLYVGEFDGLSQARIIFKTTRSGHVKNLTFSVRMECTDAPNTRLITGFLRRPINGRGFVAQRELGTLGRARVEGAGLPRSPTGTLEANIESAAQFGKDCATGLTNWAAERATLAEYRNARQGIGRRQRR